MPKDPENNNPENNEENIQDGQNVQPENLQNNEIVNDNNDNVENEQNGEEVNEQIIPEENAANVNLDGVRQQEQGYVPPVPPEIVPPQQQEEEEIGNLNINAELNQRGLEPGNNRVQNRVDNRGQNRNPQVRDNVIRNEDDPVPEEQIPQGTYLHYVGELKKAEFTEDTVARMIACAVMMQRDPNAPIDRRGTADLAEKIVRQPAFLRLMIDPNAKKLKEAGNGLALIEMLAVKENERKADMDRFVRPEEYAYEDSLFLTAVKEQLMEAEGVTPGAPRKSKKGRLFKEMMKQIEHAEELTTKGIQISGDDTRKLIDAVKKYNDGGSAIPGGAKKAPGGTEAMCILKRYMPVDEYLSYCSRINARLKHKIDPESFTERRLYGQDLSVSALKKQCRKDLENDFTLENCAALVACATTAPKNGLIDADEYEKQKAKLLEDGSAFRRAMADEKVQNRIAVMMTGGRKSNDIISEINTASMDRLGKSAQWHFNRSRNALLGGRVNTYFAGEHLSNILALHQFSLSANLCDKVTNKSFAERAEIIRNDPVFRRMADRYAGDPEYRRHINNKLREDGTGITLSEEYGRVQRSMRRSRQPEAQNDHQPEQREQLQAQPGAH